MNTNMQLWLLFLEHYSLKLWVCCDYVIMTIISQTCVWTMPTCSQRDTWQTECQAKMQLTNLNLSVVFLQSVVERCEALGPFPLRSLDLQAEQSFPYAAALKSEGSPTRTGSNSFSLVQNKGKALGKQVSSGKIAETPRLCPSDKFNCTGLFQAAADRSNVLSTCFPFIT